MRLPVAVPPARHETVASYLARLASLHGLAPGELWHQVSSPQPDTRRHEVVPDRLAAMTCQNPNSARYAGIVPQGNAACR